jgi:hypothetical protein
VCFPIFCWYGKDYWSICCMCTENKIIHMAKYMVINIMPKNIICILKFSFHKSTKTEVTLYNSQNCPFFDHVNIHIFGQNYPICIILFFLCSVKSTDSDGRQYASQTNISSMLSGCNTCKNKLVHSIVE